MVIQKQKNGLFWNIFTGTALFALLVALSFLPGKRSTAAPLAYLVVLAAIWIVFVIRSVRQPEKKQIKDINYAVFIGFIIWELVTRIYNITPEALIPSPENVFNVFTIDYEFMLHGLASSMVLLVAGFTLALVLGNILGLFVGWNDRLRNDFYPIAKVLSPIPPMIYTPYLIAIMPSFTSASIAVIALGIFWPSFMGMIYRVGSMDKRIIDSAKTLGVSTPTMLLKVILPYSIPSIVSELRIMLSTTFMVLMLAEMIGAQAGLGFYIKKYSDYADYTRVTAGILFVGVVITLLNIVISVIEKKAVKWRA